MSMEEMAREIRSLRAAMEERDGSAGDENCPESLRSMIEDGFSKISETLAPFVDEAAGKIPRSLRETVDMVGRRISERPLTSVAVAAASGFVIGRIAGRFARRRCRRRRLGDDGDE
jgi:ElaB/YqjD/DUF883 family membrane-anchored ribosome-binding protein